MSANTLTIEYDMQQWHVYVGEEWVVNLFAKDFFHGHGVPFRIRLLTVLAHKYSGKAVPQPVLNAFLRYKEYQETGWEWDYDRRNIGSRLPLTPEEEEEEEERERYWAWLAEC